MRTRSWRALVRDAGRPGHAAAMAAKVGERLAAPARQRERDEAREWAAQRSVGDASALVRALGTPEAAELWQEAAEYARGATALGHGILSPLAARGIQMGGGGDQALLYFLTRWTRPEVVVETGVAAGWSTRAVLSAMERNGAGELWSTDLPYPGLRDAASLVGILVPPDLRDRWHLRLGPDHRTVPEVLAQCRPPDLVHYDSDKSRRGRDRTLDLLWQAAAPGATVVVDDVDDNLHFRDWIARLGVGAEVLVAERKHVGLLAVPIEGADPPD